MSSATGLCAPTQPLTRVPVAAGCGRRVRDLLAAAAGFVALYSLLPHKELRFVFPVLPLLNTAAAAALARLHTNRNKAPLWRMAYAASVASVPTPWNIRTL
jgi:alpha-1,6-mannosyltransferase